MQSINVKHYYWKQPSGTILQVRIDYRDGTIKVFDEKGISVMQWKGLTILQIKRIEEHFLEVVV